MKDEARTKKELIDELISLRLKVSKLEGSQNKLRQTASELRKAEERFALLSIATNDAIHDWDLVKNQLWCNEGMQKTLGVAEFIDDPWDWWIQIIHPDDRDRMVSGMDRLIKSNQEFGSNEYRIQTAGGTSIYINHRIYVIRDRTGKPVRMIGAATDISERKRSENALRESEERYRAFFETSRDCVFISSPEGRWIDLNDAAVELFGYSSKEELKNASISELYAATEGRDRFIGQMREEGYVKEYPFDMRKKDGSIIHILLTSVVWKDADGNVLGYRGTIRDVTDKRRAEKELKAKHEEVGAAYGQLSAYDEELRQKYTELLESQQALHESEEKYRQLFMYAPAAIYEIDYKNRRFISFNDIVCTFTGYSREELMQIDPWELFTEESQRTYLERIRLMRNGTNVPTSAEYEIRNKDGGTLWAMLNTDYELEDGLPVRAKIVAHDITARKKMEEALRESEERYRYLVKHAPTGIYEVDFTTRKFLSVNDTMCQYTGYTREEFLSLDPIQLLTEQSLKSFMQRHAKVLAGEPVPDNVEFQIKSKNGSEFWVLLNVRYSYEPNNRILAMVIAHDITERKLAEGALRQSEEKYRAIIENMEEGYIEVDLAGRLAFFNEAARKFLGYSKEEMMGLHYKKYADEENAQKIFRVYSEVYRTRVSQGPFEWEVIRKDGARRTVEGSAYLIEDAEGRPIGFRGLFRDTTERKQTEEALRESETKLQAIFDTVGTGIIIIDRNTQIIVEANQTAIEMTGLPKERLIGHPCQSVVCPAEVGRCPIKDLGQSVDHSERKLLCANGHLKDILKTVYPITIKGRDFYLENFIDITEQKRAEGERRLLEERLHRAEKMEALGTLAGGVAHDLNNVLGVLVGYSELLLQNLPQDSPFRRHALQILKGGERAAAIIQDLLTLTRRGVVVSDVVNLNMVISEFLQTPEFEAVKTHHPGVTFKTSLDAELLNVKGSPMHLGKTVMNLLSNAAEAITGLGEVLITTENRYVDRPIQGYDNTQEGEYAVLTVSDTGSGISSSDIGRIFEPFYTKKAMGRSGTGLGLAVVWGTVKDHSGYIDVQSTEGKGTIFTLYFPVTREDLSKVEQVVPKSTYLGRGEHILVVDDVEGQRLLASAMLEGLGYKVSSVAGGEEAIAFVKKQPVDLLILDMIMDPGIDGLETYRRILAMRKDQKAIIVSGFAMTERVRQTQELGAGTYVKKPYLLEKIGIAVRRELDK